MADTLAGALESVTDESLGPEETEETTEETGTEQTGTEGEAEAEETEEEGAAEGEESEETEEEDEDDGSGDALAITDEMREVIRKSPELTAVYKALNGAATKKFQQAGEALKLVDAYTQDPVRFIYALANSNGFNVYPQGQAPPAAAGAAAAATERASSQPTGRLADAQKKVEALFGDKIGSQVRQVLDEYVSALSESVLGAQVGPLKDTLGRVVTEGEKSRMMSAEQTFVSRHKDMTQDIYNKVVELGNSGQIRPGNASPEQFLEHLYKLVVADESAKRARIAAKKARTEGATKLANRISQNRADREPTGVGSRSGVKPVSGVKANMSLEEAFNTAARELDLTE